MQVGRDIGVRRAQQRVDETHGGGETRQVPQVALDLRECETHTHTHAGGNESKT